jgi:putative peptide zinc metalloprotease protein
MSVLDGSSTERDDAPASSRSDVPARADGVELIGEMVGSGYRQPPSLARRGDGQTFQLTPLLYLVLSAVDGRRTYDEVAERVTAGFGKTVTGDNVRTLVDEQLRPLGLLTKPDGSQPEVKKSNPLLALRFKYAVSDPDRTRRITAPFARLFNPVLVAAVLLAFLVVCWWVLLERGLAAAAHEAFDKPGLLLLVVAVTLFSAGFHEFGHAAAARRGGAVPGVMGAGIYLVWPAFYTDVTDSYRLGRAGRVRTDLGGLYFNAIVAVAVTGVWWVTQYDALLLVVATQILQMVQQLTPLVRFDGYHVLADVTGVPDLFHRIKPTLLGMLPWRWRHPDATVLKPWARAVVTLWVVVVVPMLAFSLFTMVATLPRIIGSAATSADEQSTMLGRAWGDGDFLEVAARGIAIVAVVFPVLAIGVILFRLGRTAVVKTLQRTKGKPAQRGLAGLLAAALVAGLAFLWWPNPGTYRPIQAWEGGTLAQAVPALRPAPSDHLVAGQRGTITTGWSNKDARPTADKPVLAVVLVPRDGSGKDAEPWVFPFNKPLVPGKGDNQALAVNTTDNTIQYDVAFALVWVDDDSPALNTNESYAFASCDNCAAVSVGFQIVLVTGDNHVAAPANISAAVNYDCVNCLSYALATQLFLTLDGPLSEEGRQKIADLWQQIADYGAHIAEVPLSEIQGRLSEFEEQIIAVIEAEQGPLDPNADAGASPSATPSDGTSPSADSTDAGDPNADPSAATSDGTDPDPGSDPSASPSATDSATAASDPSATAASTP